jgi:hypothetical protein
VLEQESILWNSVSDKAFSDKAFSAKTFSDIFLFKNLSST